MRRIRIAAATAMVAAGLIGAVAAPASAAAPQYIYSLTCETRDGSFINETAIRTQGEIHSRASACIPSTRQLTIITRL